MPLDDHQFDEDGTHDEDACECCLEQTCSRAPSCGCGRCCQRLLIEVSLRDAEREPLIAKRGSPIYDIPHGSRQRIGYLLNSRDNEFACAFFDRATRLYTIYPTRPLCCRLFDRSTSEFREPG